MIEHLTDNQLAGYVYRALTDDQRAEMDRHLAACADCRTQLAEHETVQRRLHNTILARRNEATLSSRLVYASIAPRIKPPTRSIRFVGGGLNRYFSDAFAIIALLALISLLIGVFGNARQATLTVPATPIAKSTALPPAVLIYAIGRAEADLLSSPTGLGLDPQGNLYVADTGNNRILKYDSSGKRLTQWGSRGTADGQFIFGAAPNNLLNGDLAVDGQGSVYVDDTANARIQKFDGNGKFLLKWGTAGNGAGQFGHIAGIAVDSQGNVYTAEDDPQPRVQKFDRNGQFLLQWSTRPTDKGSSFHPNDIAIDHQDLIYLLDLGSGTAQTFDRTGRFISNWTPSCGSRNVITGLSSIAFDSSDNLYAADYISSRICKFDRNGQFLTQWNDSTIGRSFGLVQGIAVDPQGNVYVAEADASRIQKFQQP